MSDNDEFRTEMIGLLREIRDNTAKKPRKGKKCPPFKPPTQDEVADYIAEIEAEIDPAAFMDFNESKGWMVGKNRMKEWKAAIRTWKRRDAAPAPTSSKVCIVDHKPGFKYQSDRLGKKVWLCEDCHGLWRTVRGEQGWGKIWSNEIETTIIQARANL